MLFYYDWRFNRSKICPRRLRAMPPAKIEGRIPFPNGISKRFSADTRKQCDVQRPCTMCQRAKTNCIGSAARNTRRGLGRSSPANGIRARSNTQISPVHESHVSDAVDMTQDRDGRLQNPMGPCCDDHQVDKEGASEVPSSTTSALVETAFLYNKGSSPSNGQPQTTPTGQTIRSSIPEPAVTSNINQDYPREAINAPVQRGRIPRRPTSAKLQERLISVLPGPEAMNLLVDTYFDRAHWFLLVLHQQDFRQRLQDLHNRPEAFRTGDKSSAGFLAVLLTVLCIGLQYLGPYRRSLLRAHGIQEEELQNSVLAVLEESFLAIVSLGSLEAVQSCVLLGTFYLYHSDPTTAWSICGCALRLAQTLKLHRKQPAHRMEEARTLSAEDTHHLEARNRCWWALYEVETFCCMLYGYTCNTSLDAECDVDVVGSERDSAASRPLVSDQLPPFNLLAYKGIMSKLSQIIKRALVELYGPWTSPQSNITQNMQRKDQRHRLLQSVGDLDRRLSLWYAELPPQLSMETTHARSYETIEEYEKDIGGSGEVFNSNIISLQALSLKLAYENAIILVHRPLLAYNLNRPALQISPKNTPQTRETSSANQYQESLNACRHAALQTADIGSSPAFPFAVQSYAAAFMSTHLFTAGVTLCLSAIIEPLTEQASQAKRGLQRIFNSQNDPVAEPLASPHVTDILERLIRLVQEKELACILGPMNDTSKRCDVRPLNHHDYNVRQAQTDIGQANTLQETTSTPSHLLPSNTQQADNPNETREHPEVSSQQTFSHGHFAPTGVAQDFENVLSSLSTEQAQTGCDSSDPFMYLGNASMGFDQEQAWMWSMDPWSQVWDA
ncbi:hypothetical protein Q7P37_001760 [Cladosporium fusiforme]